MCKCKNIKMGSHKNEIIMTSWWGVKVSVDKCMFNEIKYLWNNKIKTTGCCCGHNIQKPFINVELGEHNKMINLGYEFWINQFDTICYKPKMI